ncbi:MAG: glycosyltransferase family 4 protein [Candidatus Bathyarchaeia archaeon]
MKVLMVTPFYYPVLGGSETQIENLSLELNAIGISTDIMTFSLNKLGNPLPFGKTEKINGLTVIKIPAVNPLPPKLHHNKINFMVNFIPGKFAHILDEYDVIHFHNETDLSFPAFSYAISKPKVFHLRCLNVTYFIFKRNFVCRHMLKNIADIYIAQSAYVSRLLLDLGMPKGRIRIIPNGIDTSKFKPGNKERSENTLLYVGRIEEYKGLHILLKALECVSTPVRLSIIGPLVRDPTYYKKVFDLINKINEKTRHKVTYLGPKRPEEILEYYQTASIVVVPSLSESFGNVVLEALACETPVIASKVGGIPEIINTGESGILVPPGDYTKLAEAIESLLNDGHVREKIGKEGRRLMVEKFSFESVVKKILDIYNELMCCYDLAAGTTSR